LNKNLDPRAAAEEIGYTYLPSVLIGLSNAPDIVELPAKNESLSLHPDQIESIVVPNKYIKACITSSWIYIFNFKI